MRRQLVIPAVAFSRVTDTVDAARTADPADGVGIGNVQRGRRRLVCRPQRTSGKQRQNIGQQKFLMLLLVVDADLDQARKIR